MQNSYKQIENPDQHILQDKHCLKMSFLSILLSLGFTLFLNFASSPSSCIAAARDQNTTAEQFTLWSPGFKAGQILSKRYTADGSNVSPELSWSGAPANTKSFALICEDPDAPAGTWIHWLIYDIPATRTKLPQGLPPEANLKEQIKQGVNSFRHVGYGGPSPPPGSKHRYFFKMYALDSIFGYESTMTLYKFHEFVQKHKLAEAQIIGIYGR